ncbi:MAG: hypothetical protein ORN98_04385, partial [Alphaproteobacteria bacterium]|nr:hypothetical protein [Alphaproteobacteria bacterium]
MFQRSSIYRAMNYDDKVRILVFAYQRGYSRGLAVVNATIVPRPHGVVAMIKICGYHSRVNRVEDMIT